jgi:hypothetical protein
MMNPRYFILIFLIAIPCLSFKAKCSDEGLGGHPTQTLKVQYEVRSNEVYVNIGNGEPNYKVFLMNQKGSKVDLVFDSKEFKITSLNDGKWSMGIRDGSDKYFFCEIVID